MLCSYYQVSKKMACQTGLVWWTSLGRLWREDAEGPGVAGTFPWLKVQAAFANLFSAPLELENICTWRPTWQSDSKVHGGLDVELVSFSFPGTKLVFFHSKQNAQGSYFLGTSSFRALGGWGHVPWRNWLPVSESSGGPVISREDHFTYDSKPPGLATARETQKACMCQTLRCYDSTATLDAVCSSIIIFLL